MKNHEARPKMIENSLKIKGVSFSPKKGFCIVKIWNNDSKDMEINKSI